MRWRNTFFVDRTPDSPNERAALDSSSATRIIDIYPGTVQARAQAQADFLGYATTYVPPAGTFGPGFVYRVTPHPYPLAGALIPTGRGGAPPLTVSKYASSFSSGKGIGVGSLDGSGGTNYPIYRQEVVYTARPYLIKEDSAFLSTSGTPPTVAWTGDMGSPVAWLNSRYVTKLIEPGVRYLTLRQGQVFYASDNEGINYGVPISQGIAVVHYTWELVPYAAYPAVAVQHALGCVNNATFDVWPKGTLLLVAAAPIPRQGPLGDRLLTVRYTFKALLNLSLDGTNTPFGWNGILRVSGTPPVAFMDSMTVGKGPFIVVPPSGVGPYKFYPMTNLFAPDSGLS